MEKDNPMRNSIFKVPPQENEPEESAGPTPPDDGKKDDGDAGKKKKRIMIGAIGAVAAVVLLVLLLPKNGKNKEKPVDEPAATHAPMYSENSFSVDDIKAHMNNGSASQQPQTVSVRGKEISITSYKYIKNKGVEIKWNDMGSGVTYSVYRRWAHAQDYSRIKDHIQTTSYLDSFPSKDGYMYYYYVEAKDSSGNRIESDIRGVKVVK